MALEPEDIAGELWEQEVRSRAIDIATRTMTATIGPNAHIAGIFAFADLIAAYIETGEHND